MKTDDVNGWQEEVAVSIVTCFLGDGIFSRAMPREVQVVQRKKPVVQEKGGLEDSHNQLHSNKNSKHLSI